MKFRLVITLHVLFKGTGTLLIKTKVFKTKIRDLPLRLTPGCRSSSLHAIEVSWMYQSGNKDKNTENQVINGFKKVMTFFEKGL